MNNNVKTRDIFNTTRSAVRVMCDFCSLVIDINNVHFLGFVFNSNYTRYAFCTSCTDIIHEWEVLSND
jgi:hypothetical protein